jgi:hypothetical protein
MEAKHAGPSPTEPPRTPTRTAAAPTTLTRTRFLQLSEALTGYDDAELYGTGMVDVYIGTLVSIVGDGMTGRLLQRWAEIAEAAPGDVTRVEALLRERLLEDDTLGPLARNLAYLWYTGGWNQLPAAWRDAHGANALDQTCIISPEAYTQGLVWQAIHTHPQGARQPGYGSWALPPRDESR